MHSRLDAHVSPQPNTMRAGIRQYRVLLIAAVFTLIAAFLAYPFVLEHLSKIGFLSEPFRAMKRGGPVGDSFAALNALFTGLTVVLLSFNYLITRELLDLQTEEILAAANERSKGEREREGDRRERAQQVFSSAFFEWLRQCHTIVGSTSVRNHSGEDSSEVLQGREGLFQVWGGLIALARQDYIRACRDQRIGLPFSLEDLARRLSAGNVPEELNDCTARGAKSVREAYESVYLENEYQLDFYFRNLFRFISWIDTSPDLSGVDQRWHFVRIVRAQLSWVEMGFLFLNGLTDRGRKFGILVEKYALLDNFHLGTGETIRDHHIPAIVVQRGGFGYSPRAFDSDAARKGSGYPPDLNTSVSDRA
jgi:hypothetical protein